MERDWLCRLLVLSLAGIGPALAQDKGTLNPKPLPPLADPTNPRTPAKELFARKKNPAALEFGAIGFYSRGCLAGGVALPISAEHWQVMRVSRNRYWGHPELIELLRRVSVKASTVGWPGLLIGDIGQPRGGPMLNGHASHQIGLDADVWLTPMPQRPLTAKEREEMMATVVVAADRLDVDPKRFTAPYVALIKAVAEEPEVERIFVNGAIKKALCRMAGDDRAWLSKIRPWSEHDFHFHVRISCPSSSPDCKSQEAPPPGDGCGKELDDWFTDAVLRPKPPKVTKPEPPPTLADLPPACTAVLNAP
jgi:penicillin-insensitive murein DD-endopeptidase